MNNSQKPSAKLRRTSLFKLPENPGLLGRGVNGSSEQTVFLYFQNYAYTNISKENPGFLGLLSLF